MRTRSPILVTLLASALCASAHGAVTCVLNKDSKKFESSAAKQSKDSTAAPSPCDADLAKQTLEGIQLAINSAGAKLVNSSVLVNADKLPVPVPVHLPVPVPAPVPVKQVQPITPSASRVIETPAEMLIPGTSIKPTTAPAFSAVAKVDPVKPLLPNVDTKMDWVLKASFNTLEEALENFASSVDYEVVYEAREFPLELKRDITIARGATFWEALRVLGDTYRKSDGAFQILPTKFKQIVVIPMGHTAADAGQR